MDERGDKFFYADSLAKSAFGEAFDYCQDLNLQLAKIDTEEDYQATYSFLGSINGDYTYTLLNKLL